MIGALVRLVRLPNTLSAASQIVAGAALAAAATGRTLAPWRVVVGALGAAAFYAFGMALNDWYDRDRDRRIAPGRPIPSGQISARAALIAAILLLALGFVLFAVAAPALALVGIPLALAIFLYDGPLKEKPRAAAVAMGLCRAICGLAGLVLAGLLELKCAGADLPRLLLYPASWLLLVTAVTAVSQQEERVDTRGLLPLALVTALAFATPLLADRSPVVVVGALVMVLVVGREAFGPRASAGAVVRRTIFSLPLFDALWAWPAAPTSALACGALFLLGNLLRRLVGQRSS